MTKRPNSFFNMQFITSSISTTLVLLLLGMVVFFVLSANNLSTYVRENIGISVLVSDDMKEPEALKFQKTLNEKSYVKESVYISKEQALKEQTEAMGTDPAEFLGYNPFTASIEIKLNALISFALINNTIRLAIYSKRFLIHTMKLVGASWSFIRRPFLVRNVWIGVLAGIMADAILLGMAYMLVKYEPQLIEIITPNALLIVMASVFVFGLAITFLCAYISINKYLRMKASALYYI